MIEPRSVVNVRIDWVVQRWEPILLGGRMDLRGRKEGDWDGLGGSAEKSLSADMETESLESNTAP